MSKTKKQLGIICGGASAEHEISLISAKNILEALDTDKYEPHLFAVDKTGHWYYCPNTDWLPKAPNQLKTTIKEQGQPVAIIPGATPKPQIYLLEEGRGLTIDIMFPIIHGSGGEDGALQGLLTLMKIPYVGCNVLSSAIGMDKEVMKRLLLQAGIKTAKHLTFYRQHQSKINSKDVQHQLGLPIFVKPANLGSSIGISKVKHSKDFAEAINLAFQHDNKIIIEENITGQEIECAVLGNQNPQASPIGEIKTPDFYSYQAKYLNNHEAELIIPAQLTADQASKAQKLALKVYQVLDCSGLTRVDMFHTPQGDLYINEVNTLPGFTSISMYPKLWEHAGLSYSELITKVLTLAEGKD